MIRTAAIDDDDQLVALDVAAWDPTNSPGPRPTADDPFFQDGRPISDTFVAELDGRVAGYVLVGAGWPMQSHAHVAHLRGLAVAAEFRGRGIARDLVEHALGQLALRGARRIRSRVLATNPASLAVHAACGFVEEGRLRGEFVIEGIGPVDDVLLAFTFDDPPAP